jgi:hypothetical protein
MRGIILGLLLTASTAAASVKVEVTPATRTWKLKQAVPVRLVVTNTSAATVRFDMMTCTWDEHWTSSPAALAWEVWGCLANAKERVELAPGAARTWKLDMFATQLGDHEWTMTFQPTQTTSKPLTITVTK